MGQELVTANLPFNLEIFLSTNTNPVERYQAIDGHVRSWYKIVMTWPYIAKYCEIVEQEKLYEHGGFDSMTAWLKVATPRCERSLRGYMSLRKNLSSEFTDDEMSAMEQETAKVIVDKIPKAHRKNPRIREAAKKPKEEFIEEVKKEAPELHIETELKKLVTFTESQMIFVESIRHEFCEDNDLEEISWAAFIEALCAAWQQSKVKA